MIEFDRMNLNGCAFTVYLCHVPLLYCVPIPCACIVMTVVGSTYLLEKPFGRKVTILDTQILCAYTVCLYCVPILCVYTVCLYCVPILCAYTLCLYCVPILCAST